MTLNEILTELGEIKAKYYSGKSLTDNEVGKLLDLAYLLAGKVRNTGGDPQ